ncbi:MAG: DMT family transporter [Thermoanaerobaculia bacterium]
MIERGISVGKALNRHQAGLPSLALMSASVLWGAGFVLAKIALSELTVLQTVACRFAVGSIALGVASGCAWRRVGVADLSKLVVCGLLMVPVTYGLQFEGIRRLNASNAAVVSGVLPALLAVSGIIMLRERSCWRTWAAILLSIAGVFGIARAEAIQAIHLGVIYVLASLVAITAWTLISKRLMERHSVLTTTFLSVLAGTVAALALALWADGIPQVPSLEVTLAVVGSGLFCTAGAYGLWNWGLRRTSVGEASVFVNIETVTGVILGELILRETLNARTITGGVLVVAGAALVGDSRSKKARLDRSADESRGASASSAAG